MTAPDTTTSTDTTTETTSAAPIVEQRAADQDAAIEQAFVAGTLLEEDRRAPEGPAFPHDAMTPHAIDNLPPGTAITKVDAATIVITGPTGHETRTIPPDDAVAHLPVGATVDIGMPGPTATTIRLPASATRLGPVTSMGSRFHEALLAAWHWIAS